MTLEQQASLMIRSLMRALRVSEHIVFHGDGNIVSNVLLAQLEEVKPAPIDNSASDAVAEEEFQIAMHGYRNQP